MLEALAECCKHWLNVASIGLMLQTLAECCIG